MYKVKLLDAQMMLVHLISTCVYRPLHRNTALKLVKIEIPRILSTVSVSLVMIRKL